MAYSSDSDLLKEFSNAELARLTGDSTGTTVDSTRTSHARAMADALIDSYLKGRYSTPLAEPVDALINKISTDLTVANLYDFQYANSSVPNAVVWRKIGAVGQLKDLRKGVLVLQIATPGTNAAPLIISNKSGDRLFGEDVLDKFS